MQDKASVTLRQKDSHRGERRFELKAGRELHVAMKCRQKACRFALSVLAMAPEGKVFYVYAKHWLALVLVSIVALIVVPLLARWQVISLEAYMPSVMVALFFAALLFSMLLYRSFSRSYVFFSVHTKLPLVELWVNNPDRPGFQAFVRELEHCIKHHRDEMNVAYERQLAGELRTLRRVTEAGLLSESVYIAAKAKLLLMSDDKQQMDEGSSP